MKASDLIKEIEALIKQYGDLPVKHHDGIADNEVIEASAYTDSGNQPDKENKEAVEIYLH